MARPTENPLAEGTKLKSIFWAEGVVTLNPVPGCPEVKSIQVVDIPGQMGYVPWAEVRYVNSDTVMLYNLAHVEGCEVLHDG